jgi:hypothetical protein
MNGHGESDRVVVPEKPPNKEEKAGEVPVDESAEEVEERTLAKENSRQQNTHRTQGRESVRSALARVRRAAEEDLSFSAARRHHPRQEPSAVVPLAGICAGGGPKGPFLPRPPADRMGGWKIRNTKFEIRNPTVLEVLQ